MNLPSQERIMGPCVAKLAWGDSVWPRVDGEARREFALSKANHEPLRGQGGLG